jgi:hypothetical protein
LCARGKGEQKQPKQEYEGLKRRGDLLFSFTTHSRISLNFAHTRKRIGSWLSLSPGHDS